MLCPSFLRAGTRRGLHTHWPLLLGFPFLFLLYACDSDVGGALAPEDVLADIVLSASSLELSPGDTVRLEVTLINKNGKPMPSKVPLDWSTSNENVASVDQAGLVLAKNRGEAKITVGRGSIESSVPVTVQGGSEPEDPPGDDPGEDDPEPEDPPEDDPGEDDPEDEPEPEDPPEDDPGEDDPEDEPEPEDPPSAPGIDRTMDGFHSGFTVPAGETWQVLNVETDRNVVVLGKLVMRPGASLTFVNVDESKFIGGGMDVLDSDVGLWVMGNGVLDIQGTPKQGWNRTGSHSTWLASDEYVRAPHGGESGPQPWSLGDPIPCTTFAGNEYCAEVANLTRDVLIQGTEAGQSHIFIRSNRSQTIRHALLRFMGPNGDSDSGTPPPVGSCCPDGRYAIHFHHSGHGSHGSIVEGVVIRDTGDHAYAPHESHGITLRDNVAYNVLNTAYWWDPGDRSHDIVYDRNLALGVGGNRESTTSLAGFRMATGERNVAIGNVAAAVSGGRGSSGYLWNDGSPNKWEFRDNVSHHNNNALWHWRNEGREPFAPHVQHGFVAYRNSRFAIEQGAYESYGQWHGSVLFDNGMESIRHRHAPNKFDPRIHSTQPDVSPEDLIPGTRYVGGVIGGGLDRGSAIAVESRRHCEGPEDVGQHTLFEDLWLLPQGGHAAVKVDQSADCRREDGRFHLVFRRVVVGPEKRQLERSDFDIIAMPTDGIITVERADGTTFTIEP